MTRKLLAASAVLVPLAISAIADIQAMDHSSNPPYISVGERFTVGPFSSRLLPQPLEITMTTQADCLADTNSHAAVEIDKTGNEIAAYPCYSLATPEAGIRRVTFIPFTDNQVWPAGRERHFRICPVPSTPETAERLTINLTSKSFQVANRYYVLDLAPPNPGLAGGARIIREIRFGNESAIFRLSSCLSEIAMGSKRYFWHFDPSIPPVWNPGNGHVATLRYGGIYRAKNEVLDGIRWYLTMTFYAALPLIKIEFERLQELPSIPHKPIKRQTGLEMVFNANASDLPFVTVAAVQRSAWDRGRDLLVAEGPKALLAILLTDGRTFGNAYFQPEVTRYAFVTAETENVNTIRSRTDYTAYDIHVFYLLATDNISMRDDLPDIWQSLYRLRDLDDRIRVRRLLDEYDAQKQGDTIQ